MELSQSTRDVVNIPQTIAHSSSIKGRTVKRQAQGIALNPVYWCMTWAQFPTGSLLSILQHFRSKVQSCHLCTDGHSKEQQRQGHV